MDTCQKSCVITAHAVRQWSSDNSTVLSLPPVALTKSGGEALNFAGASLVEIEGESQAGLHYHKSSVYALVLSGRGRFQHVDRDQRVVVTNVQSGNLVEIPPEAYHLFHTAKGENLTILALEVSSEEIDYQAHWQE